MQPATWAIAHTTQFAKPGWRYLDSACGMLADETGSYVTLAAPGKSGDYSIIIETMDAKSAQTLALKPAVGLSLQALHVWRSTSNQQFEQLEDLKPEQGRMSLMLEPGAIYSLTTTHGQSKGEPKSTTKKAFPFPYRDDFESGAPGGYAKYLSDQGGVFEVAKRADGEGRCLRQTVLRRAIDWNGHPNPEPYSVIGSHEWRDYEVACDVLVEKAGYAAVFGRVANCPQKATPPLGACLRVHTAGRWEILHSNKVLASGSIDFQADRWHSLALQCQGPDLIALVNGREVGRTNDPQPECGMAGLGGGVHGAQFDNLIVRSVPGHEPEVPSRQ